MKWLEPGIYFDLPEEIYHADRALSRSDIVNLLDTPNTYWEKSWMNPNRREGNKTEEMNFGSAFHYVLFQPHEFDKRYRSPVDPWDGRKMITTEEFQTITDAIKVLRKGSDSSLFLSGGMPEVTIVYDEELTGLRHRTRHDYFTPIITADFKTAHSLNEQLLKIEVDRRGYDAQEALYKRARKRFKEQFRKGEAHVYGHVDKSFFDKFMEEDVDDFMLIVQRKTRPYPFEVLILDNETGDAGWKKIMDSSKIYLRWWNEIGVKTITDKKTGLKTPVEWPVSEGKAREFSKYYGFSKS